MRSSQAAALYQLQWACRRARNHFKAEIETGNSSVIDLFMACENALQLFEISQEERITQDNKEPEQAI